jgi:hypothetical protein
MGTNTNDAALFPEWQRGQLDRHRGPCTSRSAEVAAERTGESSCRYTAWTRQNIDTTTLLVLMPRP